jgi:ribonuclease Z
MNLYFQYRKYVFKTYKRSAGILNKMEIVFLGTSCMVPTKERNHQGIFISHKEEGILADCGEGIQRQFRIADIKPTKITAILISHWHGDHVLGLPGLLQTMNASGYEKKLKIFGPRGTKEKFEFMFKAFSFSLAFEYEIKEIEEKETTDLKDLQIIAAPLEHGIPCLGYALQEKEKRRIRLPFVKKLGIPEGPLLGKLQDNKEVVWKGQTITPEDATYVMKGKKISIILDTTPCNAAVLLAKDSDLLISEAVYVQDLLHKSEEYKHMTARQAAELASKSGSKKLILTHFSQRYKTSEQLVEEAKDIFNNVIGAHDFLKIKI